MCGGVQYMHVLSRCVIMNSAWCLCLEQTHTMYLCEHVMHTVSQRTSLHTLAGMKFIHFRNRQHHSQWQRMHWYDIFKGSLPEIVLHACKHLRERVPLLPKSDQVGCSLFALLTNMLTNTADQKLLTKEISSYHAMCHALQLFRLVWQWLLVKNTNTQQVL